MPARPEVVARNFAAVDDTLAHLHQVAILPVTSRSATIRCRWHRGQRVCPARHRRDAGGRGDRIPVSMLPVDGTYPTATSRFEKRDIAREIPIWNSDICIQCGNCVFVCPTRRYEPSSTIRTGWRAPRGSPVGTRHCQGLPRQSLHPAALSGGLHRLRSVRAGLSGAGRSG